ncbi:hypothetical protein [Paramagnetospirillum marisnigri]|nr:hypothetical protein [Paramagnetospirillum marisnigri]
MMVGFSALFPSTSSALPVRPTAATKTVTFDSRPGLARTSTTTGDTPRGKEVGAKTGAEAVSKGITASTNQFTELSKLQEQLSAATQPGTELTTDQVKAINQQIKDAVASINKQTDSAKVGDTNLLASNPGGVTVSTSDGTKVNITSRGQDSQSLGLTDKDGKAIEVTDLESLRKAVGTIAQAVGQTQLTTYQLQAASGLTSPAKANPGIEAYDKINEARSSAPKPGSALASVQLALDNARAANAAGYGRTAKGHSAATPSILSLFA